MPAYRRSGNPPVGRVAGRPKPDPAQRARAVTADIEQGSGATPAQVPPNVRDIIRAATFGCDAASRARSHACQFELNVSAVMTQSLQTERGDPECVIAKEVKQSRILLRELASACT